MPLKDTEKPVGNLKKLRDSLTGWKFPHFGQTGDSRRRSSIDTDGISHFLPKGARLFLPTEDIKTFERADDSLGKKNDSGQKDSEIEDNTNMYLYDDSIWTINPDEPLLEETSYEYDRARRTFLIFFTVTTALAVFLLISVYTWVFKYGGGIIPNASISNSSARETDEMKKYYNIHTIVIMTSVFILHFENILIFRVFPHVSKFRLKCIHATTATIGAVGVVAALIFAIKGHIVNGDSSFTSIHGCVGIMTMALYEFQFLLGFSTFLLPYASLKFRARVVPVHKFFGGMTFLCGVTSVVTGVVVIIKVFIPLKLHSTLPLQSILLNAVGVFTVFFAMLITFLMTARHFRRRPRPELHLGMDTDKHGRNQEVNVASLGNEDRDSGQFETDVVEHDHGVIQTSENEVVKTFTEEK